MQVSLSVRAAMGKSSKLQEQSLRPVMRSQKRRIKRRGRMEINGFLTLGGYSVNNKTGAKQMTATQTNDHATLALVLFLIGLVALAFI